jgi:hypothetical protein
MSVIEVPFLQPVLFLGSLCYARQGDIDRETYVSVNSKTVPEKGRDTNPSVIQKLSSV